MATANNLGTAYIKIAPQMQGIQSTIASALGSAGTSGGESFNKSFSLKAGAIAGIISSVTTKAISAITNQLDNAITRVDTLNVFPKIMKNLGYETDESSRSLERLTQRIEGLPTTLDEIVTWTQRLASSMDSLADGEMNATDLAIAFNDAALSGGKGQAEANRAFEQYVQIIGRGRPMMQDWKIMLEVMPGQLKQITRYLGQNSESLQKYAKNIKKTVDQLDGMDLYEWISEEKNAYAKERLAEFNQALVTLDKEGGAGIVAFKDQVGDATHTIGTAMRLIGVRISKALATVIQAFGANDIYEAIDKFTQSFKGIGEWIAANIVPVIKDVVIPVLKNVFAAIKNVFEFVSKNESVKRALVIVLEGFIAFKVVSGILATVTTAFTAMVSAAGIAAGAITAVIAAVNLGIEVANAATAAVEHDNHVLEEQRKQLVNVENAQRQVNKAKELEQKILEDLETAKRLQNDAEYQELLAKERMTEAERTYAAALTDSSVTEEKKRMRQLELKAAQDAYTDATKKHAEAVDRTNKIDQQQYDNMLTALHRTNQLVNAQMLEDKSYGNLAKRLDEMKNKTITYTNAQGELVKMSKKDMTELADWYASELSRNDAIWKTIVDSAKRNGTTYVEEAKKMGKLAGEGQMKHYVAGIDTYAPMVYQVSQEVIDIASASIAKRAKEQASKPDGIISSFYQIGVQTMLGFNKGLKEKFQYLSDSLQTMFGVSMPKSVKKALGIKSPSRVFMQIGEQVDAGLIKGLDNYSDEIVQKAESIADSIIDPFSKEAELNLGGGPNNYSSYSDNMAALTTPQQNQVVQNNTFNQVADDLDVEQASKLLGWQVATAL